LFSTDKKVGVCNSSAIKGIRHHCGIAAGQPWDEADLVLRAANLS
jgi:hypothetical protein